MATGDITELIIDSLLTGVNNGTNSRLLHVSGSVYMAFQTEVGNDGWLVTFSCDNNGSLGAVIDSWEFDAVYADHAKLIHISGTTYAIVYRGEDLYGYIKTFTVATDGTITKSFLDTQQIIPIYAYAYWPDIIQVSGSVYAVAFLAPNYNNDGVVRTFTIAANGQISDMIDEIVFSTSVISYPRIFNVTGTDIYVVVCGQASPVNYRGVAFSFTIDSAGQIGAAVINTLQWQAASAAFEILDAAKVGSGTFCIFYMSATGALATITCDGSGTLAFGEVQLSNLPTIARGPRIMLIPGSHVVIITASSYGSGNLSTVQTWTVNEDGTIPGDMYVDSWAWIASSYLAADILHIAGSIYMIIRDSTIFTLTIATPTIVFPSDPTVRVTSLVHRYDARRGIYQLEVSLGDVTSNMELPYELTADRATASAKQDQDTVPFVKRAAEEAYKKFIEWAVYRTPMTSAKMTYTGVEPPGPEGWTTKDLLNILLNPPKTRGK